MGWNKIQFTSCTDYSCTAYYGPGKRGTVIFLHGWGDHAGRYFEIGQQLCRAGFAVLIPDFYGHGRSQGPRARIDNFQQLINDVGTLLEEDWAQGPTVLIGHNMGGCLAFHAGIVHADKLDGVIFNSASLTIPPSLPMLKRWLTRLLGSVAPQLALAHLKQPAMMSSIPGEIQAYKNDDLLYHGKIEAGTGRALIRSHDWVARNMQHFKLPFLALQGTKDVLAPAKGPERLMQRSPQANKTLVRFPSARYDLLHDTSKERVHKVVHDWLNQLCTTAPPST